MAQYSSARRRWLPARRSAGARCPVAQRAPRCCCLLPCWGDDPAAGCPWRRLPDRRRPEGRSRTGAEAEAHCASGGVGRSGVGAGQRTDGGIGDSALGSGRDRSERGMDSHLWTSCWALLIWAHMLYMIVYIYEYLLVFSSKSWVCLGIQGHTPSAAPGHRAHDPDEHLPRHICIGC